MSFVSVTKKNIYEIKDAKIGKSKKLLNFLRFSLEFPLLFFLIFPPKLSLFFFYRLYYLHLICIAWYRLYLRCSSSLRWRAFSKNAPLYHFHSIYSFILESLASPSPHSPLYHLFNSFYSFILESLASPSPSSPPLLLSLLATTRQF